MTTLTGIWGNVVVRDGQVLPLAVDDVTAALTLDHGYSPLYQYFSRPVQEDSLLVVPSTWGAARQQAWVRLCQQGEEVYPAWQIAAEWMKIDAAECLPRYLLVVECTQMAVSFTLVTMDDEQRVFTRVNPGMGCAPVVQDSEPNPQRQAIAWAQSMAVVVRLMVEEVQRDCDVLLLTGVTGRDTDACELVCDTLRSEGIVSYRLTSDDMEVIYRERQWRVAAEQHRAVAETQVVARRPKRLSKFTRTDGAVLAMIAVAVVSIVLAGVFGTEKQPARGASEGASPSVRTVAPAQVVSFPGGVVELPDGWTVVEEAPSVVSRDTREQWRTIIAPVHEANVRMLLTVKQDPDRHVRSSLRHSLENPSAEIALWASTYQWPREGRVPALALSYREITGEVSRADWVVFYSDRYVYSVGCQYRLQEGLTEQRAHRHCQDILNRVRVS